MIAVRKVLGVNLNHKVPSVMSVCPVYLANLIRQVPRVNSVSVVNLVHLALLVFLISRVMSDHAVKTVLLVHRLSWTSRSTRRRLSISNTSLPWWIWWRSRTCRY